MVEKDKKLKAMEAALEKVKAEKGKLKDTLDTVKQERTRVNKQKVTEAAEKKMEKERVKYRKLQLEVDTVRSQAAKKESV